MYCHLALPILEAANRLLKAKLVVLQEEMDKIVKSQGVKVHSCVFVILENIT